DHGGNPFQVITSVKGYGGSTTDKASFAGNQASMIDIAGLDLNGDKIIDGWAELWDISKPANTSGNFEYTARSINAPGNSMSVGIQIR
ncbi:hypothetical protein RCL78_04480, partial [Escherichia coli]|nr:hypothetical protein [Escherichia coli]